MPPKTKGTDELSIMKYFFELACAEKVSDLDEEMRKNLAEAINRHTTNKACDFFTRLGRWPTTAETNQINNVLNYLRDAQNNYNAYKKRRDNVTPGCWDFQVYAAKVEGLASEVEFWDREANAYIDSLLKPEKAKEQTTKKSPRKKTVDTGEPSF